jgi:predicted metalloprotease
VHDLNAFWQRVIGAAGTSYRAPTVKTLEAPVETACGPAGPEDLAFYCRAEEAIYYAPAGLAAHRRRIGDFAPIVVLAHEWGHHLQRLLGLASAPGNTVELQADCLAGAYTSDAGRRGLLDPGDITEAVAMAATMGDPLGLPQDTPGAHGINDDRITAFMRGYLGGVDACAVPEDGRRRGPDEEGADPQPREHQPHEAPGEPFLQCLVVKGLGRVHKPGRRG